MNDPTNDHNKVEKGDVIVYSLQKFSLQPKRFGSMIKAGYTKVSKHIVRVE